MSASKGTQSDGVGGYEPGSHGWNQLVDALKDGTMTMDDVNRMDDVPLNQKAMLSIAFSGKAQQPMSDKQARRVALVRVVRDIVDAKFLGPADDTGDLTVCKIGALERHPRFASASKKGKRDLKLLLLVVALSNKRDARATKPVIVDSFKWVGLTPDTRGSNETLRALHATLLGLHKKGLVVPVHTSPACVSWVPFKRDHHTYSALILFGQDGNTATAELMSLREWVRQFESLDGAALLCFCAGVSDKIEMQMREVWSAFGIHGRFFYGMPNQHTLDARAALDSTSSLVHVKGLPHLLSDRTRVFHLFPHPFDGVDIPSLWKGLVPARNQISLYDASQMDLYM